MRRLVLFLAALLFALPLTAQDGSYIRYYPPTSTLTSGGSSFFAGGISLGNTVASPYANLFGDAANTLALRNGTSAQTFNIYNTYTDAANSEYGQLTWDANLFYVRVGKNGAGTARALRIGTVGAQYWVVSPNSPYSFAPGGDDVQQIGTTTLGVQHLFLLRSIQGSKSKALVDNTATAFVRLAVADDDYEGCEVIYTAYAEDTATDARQTRTGKVAVAVLNNSGTEAAVFSTGDSAVAVTAGTFTCTFDGNSGAADTIDLRATCDTSLAATTTLTFEWRLDCPSIVTITPQ